MKINSVKYVCFSPTGTTKTITKGIMEGINHDNSELLDITSLSERSRVLNTSNDELLVLAVPSYVGRVPAIVSEWLNTLKAHNTPTVCVVVYGNRDYDDQLLELKDIMVNRGCIPIAFGAFIGEHSFSTTNTPIAVNRPDAKDLKQATSFGNIIAEKLDTITSTDGIKKINVPGNYPYRGATKTWVIDFIKTSNECTHCGICSEQCPVGAIDAINHSIIDIDKCILCCACMKKCPQKCKTMKPGLVKDAAIRVSNNFAERKEPVFFL